MKSTEVDESLSTTSTTVLFQRKPTYFKIILGDVQKSKAIYFQAQSCQYMGWLYVLASKLLLSTSCQSRLKASFKHTGIGLQTWVQYLDPMVYDMGDLESIQYPQRHLGSFAKFATCLSPTWELVVVNQTLYLLF